MDTQPNPVDSLRKNKLRTVRSVDRNAVGFTEQYRLLDVRLLAYLMKLTKPTKEDENKREPLRTVWHVLARLVAEKRISFQKLSQRDRYLYRAKGTRAVEKDYIAHTIDISEAAVGFVLGLRTFCNLSDASPFTDARLVQPWRIWKFQGIDDYGELIPDKLFTITIPEKGRQNFALEIETGKIQDRAKQQHRMAAYLAYRKQFAETNGEHAAGVSLFRVLYLSEDWWTDELREICRSVCPKPTNFFLFCSRSRWTLDNPLSLIRSPVWQSAWGEPQHLIKE